MSIANKLQKLIDGKQYVVDKVNAKTGGNLTIDSKWEDIGDNVDGLGSGGIDTNDATATSSDILLGKTAYVKGEKITGNIKTFDGEFEGGALGTVITVENETLVITSPSASVENETLYLGGA